MDNEEILQSLEKARTGANENETRLLNQCYIRDNNTGYRNTVYHCTGVPFTKSYSELDWTARLFYCLLGHLPATVKLYDGYEYRQKF